MKKLYFLFFMTSAIFCSAQTTLVSGDIAVIYHLGETNAAPYGATFNVDRVGLLLLRDITTGTVFKVTENGSLDGTALDTDEGIITFTAQSDLSAGTVIDILAANANQAPNPVGVFSTPDGAVETSGTYSLATSGDQSIVYTGTEANPNYIYSAFFDGTSWDALGACTGGCSGTESVEPNSGVTFAFGPTASGEHDNNWYMGPTTFNSAAEALAAISNPANWTGESSNSGAADTAADAMQSSGFMLFPLSTDSFSMDAALSIYPNPSNGFVTISNSGIALESAQVTDVNGRIVANVNLNGTTDNKQLNLSQLTSGMYFVTIASKEASTVKKLIIK